MYLTHSVDLTVVSQPEAIRLKNFLEYWFADFISDHVLDDYWWTPNTCVVTCGTEQISDSECGYVVLFVDAVQIFGQISVFEEEISRIVETYNKTTTEDGEARIVRYEIQDLRDSAGKRTNTEIRKILSNIQTF